METFICLQCGETENLHPNYTEDGLESILCNECGYITDIEEQE